MKIYNLLQECKIEGDVSEKYKRVMMEYFPTAKIGSPHRTDGLLEGEFKMLMEFKYDIDLTKRLDLVGIIIQILYYLKKFEVCGEDLPTILFGGDKDECFCLHSNHLLKYLNEDIDWELSPSSASLNNPQLSQKLYNDENINPFIFHINNDHFDFKYVVDKIKQLHEGTTQKVRITELNINRFFSYFRDRIVKQPKKYSAEDLVSVFLGCLIDSANNYPHPITKNKLVTNIVEKDVLINRSLYDSSFDHFEDSYSVVEKKRLTAICDRLISDEARRFRGEFYTPTEWVLEAHKMIEEQFGPNWKEEYVVWDPAWGTGNLTRDFKFKELYCSTLNWGDLKVGQHYNPEAIKFQYDFLNDDVVPDGLLPADKIKLPRGLVIALQQGKPIIIFMNPPYAKATPFKGIDGTGLSDTKINGYMLKDGMNIAASQLYAQFLYRCAKLNINNNINLAFFAKSMFLSGSSFNSFRKYLLSKFKYEYGMLFNASHFSNTSACWGIDFSIWKSGSCNDINNFIHSVKDYNLKNEVVSTQEKNIYNTDNLISLSTWYNTSIYNKREIEAPNVNGPLKIKDSGINKLTVNSIGSINNHANNQMQQRVIFLSSTAVSLNGFKPIEKQNFDKAISTFISRVIIAQSWINDKDEYLAPNEQHPEYSQWNTDAIIYSLFNGSSNQSSLRQITYKDRLWDIKNEWFWMPNSQMLQLANERGFDEMYHDANGSPDRFVYNKIQESTFSPDALAVYNKACELVVKTFQYRQILHEEHPEWHLQTWDAGWYQIKLILKKYFKNDLVEFITLYKTFENRMREGVYTFGFLK